MHTRRFIMKLKNGLIYGLIYGLVSLSLAACINTINIKPDLTKIEPVSKSAARIPLNVGFYLPEGAIERPLIDENNLRYFAYRDIETGYQKMLTNVFASATRLPSTHGGSPPPSDKVDLIFTPEITTKSGGSDALTWPPTSFTVNLTSNVQDAKGKPVATVIVTGTGSAGSAERLKVTGIAGTRAMEDALLKMQAELSAYPYSGQPSSSAITPPSTLPVMSPSAITTTPNSAAPTNAISERLVLLNDLKAKGLISQKEYDDKRKEIIDSL